MMNSYRIRENDIHIYLRGEIKAQTMTRLFQEIDADPAFDCSKTQFWYVQEITCEDLDVYGLARTSRSEVYKPAGSAPIVALIADGDFAYGICREYVAWLDSSKVEISVFRTYASAKLWSDRFKVSANEEHW